MFLGQYVYTEGLVNPPFFLPSFRFFQELAKFKEMEEKVILSEKGAFHFFFFFFFTEIQYIFLF